MTNLYAHPQLPTVTVLITCYNYARFLTQCVNSVLAQKGVNVSAIIIDDASTDESAYVASALAQKDPRVRLISLSENIGVIRAVNLGLREIEGQYFVKLDADDLLTPGSLQRSVALLERFPNVGFVYGRPRHFVGDGTPPRARLGHPRWMVWQGTRWLAMRFQQTVNCISQPEAMIRTSTLRCVGAYNTELPHTYDLEMWLRLAAVADVGRINGVDQGLYRVHPNSMQRTVNAGLLTDLVGRREAFLSLLSGAPGRLPDAADLEATVRRALAAKALDRACRAFDRDRLEQVPVDGLVEFATATFAAASTLAEWRALMKRKRRGRRSRWAPTCMVPAILRRVREEVAYARWLRTGI